MKAKTPILVLLIAATALVPALAVAQQPAGTWRGQDNEFGSIRTPYEVAVDGSRAPIEATVVLRKNYDEKDSRFFMFAFTVRGTPLDVTFDSLVRVDTDQEMPCYKSEGESDDQLKCFVDLRDMPPVGTEIVMLGTVGGTRTGTFQVGAMVVPFTYTWLRVPMNNGLDAELYGDTVVNVNSATDGGSNRLSGLGNTIPGVGAIGVVGALGAVAAALARTRRR